MEKQIIPIDKSYPKTDGSNFLSTIFENIKIKLLIIIELNHCVKP